MNRAFHGNRFIFATHTRTGIDIDTADTERQKEQNNRTMKTMEEAERKSIFKLTKQIVCVVRFMQFNIAISFEIYLENVLIK